MKSYDAPDGSRNRVRTSHRPERLATRVDELLDRYQRYRTRSYYEEAALCYANGVKHIATVSFQIRQQGTIVAGHSAAGWMEQLAIQVGWLSERAQKGAVREVALPREDRPAFVRHPLSFTTDTHRCTPMNTDVRRAWHGVFQKPSVLVMTTAVLAGWFERTG